MRACLATLVLFTLAACARPGASTSPAPPTRGHATATSEPTPTAAPPSADALSADALMADVRWLAAPAQRGRGSATEDERRAAAWIAAALEREGIPALAPPGYVRPFPLGDGRHSVNVVATVASPRPLDDRVVVLGAHLDHVGEVRGRIHPGADDNASGVAVALGVTRAVARDPSRLRRRLVVAFFGAEEIGLRGSWAFVREPTVPLPSIVGMIALDMLGRPLVDQPPLRFAASLVGIEADRSIGVDGLRERPWLEAIVRGACAAEGHRAITVDDLPAVVQRAAEQLSRGRSDHFPFEQSGVPAVILSDGESTDYHQPTDTPEVLRPDLLATRARIVLRAVEDLSAATPPPVAPPPAEPPP